MTGKTDIIPAAEAGTLPGLFHERVRRSPEGEAYRRFDGDNRLVPITWSQMAQQAARWQAALVREGMRAGDRVALMVQNSPEWVLFDLAALGLGLVTVPLYVNDRPDNCAYILGSTRARLILIAGDEQWQRLREVLPGPLSIAVHAEPSSSDTPGP